MPETVVVFRIGQLGDTLAALPAISAIRTGYPSARMLLITDWHPGQEFVSSFEVLESTGIFSKVLFYAPSLYDLKGLLKYAELIRTLRSLRPGILFYLAPLPRSNKQVARDRFFFQTLCGIRKTHGLEATHRLLGRRDETGRLIRLPSETDRLLSIVAKAGLAVPVPGEAKCEVPIGGKEQGSVNNLWRQAKLLDSGPIIGIGPGSKMPAKRWPLSRFAVVGMRLIEIWPNARLLIFGGPEDRELGERIRESIGVRVVNWAGQLTVLESAEALRRCALYVGNDTGTMHLAAAVGTRCVGIFSARDHPGKWEPYGRGHIILRKDVACAGCLLTVCDQTQRGMMCLMEISVNEVFSACVEVLRSRRLRINGDCLRRIQSA